MVSDKESNGGPASCPQEDQITTTEIDKEDWYSRSGKVSQVIKKKDTERYLQYTTFSPAVTFAPFGSLPGFRTSQGIIAPPRESVGGYVLEGREWILHATTSSYY